MVTQENEEKALLLHALPAPAEKAKFKKKEERTEGAAGDSNEHQDALQPQQEKEVGSVEDQVEKEGEESAGDRVKMITEALSGTKKCVRIRLDLSVVC